MICDLDPKVVQSKQNRLYCYLSLDSVQTFRININSFIPVAKAHVFEYCCACVCIPLCVCCFVVVRVFASSRDEDFRDVVLSLGPSQAYQIS